MSKFNSAKHELKARDNSHSFLTSISWLTLEKAMQLASALIIGIWIANYLGPQNFGFFSYAQSIISILIAIAMFGMDGIIVKDLTQNKHQLDSILSSALILKLTGSLVACLILTLILVTSNQNSSENWLLIVIGSSLLLQCFTVFELYFQSQVKNQYPAFAKITALLISALLKVILILNQAPLLYFGIAILIESICFSSLIFYFFYKQLGRAYVYSPSLKKCTELLRSSWPLALSGLSIILYLKIDQIMIEKMLNSEQVGIYAAAAKISEAWYFLPIIISNTVFPALVKLKAGEQKTYFEFLRNIYTTMSWLAILIAIPTYLYSEEIVLFLFNASYLPAASVLSLHVWSGIFVFWLHASGRYLIAEGLHMHALFRNLIGAIVNISLNFYLIPTLGIWGAALATLISYAFAGFLYDLSSNKLRSQFILKLTSFFYIHTLLMNYKAQQTND
ncbi:flippase [Aliikangiella sp. IMCC44653]